MLHASANFPQIQYVRFDPNVRSAIGDFASWASSISAQAGRNGTSPWIPLMHKAFSPDVYNSRCTLGSVTERTQMVVVAFQREAVIFQ